MEEDAGMLIYFNGRYFPDMFLVKGLANGSVAAILRLSVELDLTNSALGHVPPSPGNYFPDCVSTFHNCVEGDRLTMYY
jgi:hypothetical protein